jgi:WD40 repeat protein
VNEVYALAFSPDGKSLVSGCKDGSIWFWDPNGGPKPGLTLSLPAAIRRLAFLPDSQTFHTLNQDGSISLWKAATAHQTTTCPGLGTNNTSLAISPGGNLLLAGTDTGAIKVWNRVTQRELTNFTAHAAPIEHLQYRLNGRVLVSAARDSRVKLWDASSWREQTICRTEHDFWVFDASADARLAALAGGTTVEVWDLATGKRLTSLAGDLGWVDDVAFSPDGALLATASQRGSAILYEVGTWREAARLRGVLQAVHSVTFAPDGRRLLTGNMPKEGVKLWDLVTLQELVTFQTEGSWGSLWTGFSPDGNTLAAVSQEGPAYLWRAPSLIEIDAAETGGNR